MYIVDIYSYIFLSSNHSKHKKCTHWEKRAKMNTTCVNPKTKTSRDFLKIEMVWF